jgi:chemotaxis protein histidine kinase CheA
MRVCEREVCVMQTENQQTESTATDKSPKTDIETSVHELKRAGALFRQNENDNAETAAANNLATLLQRVSVVATQEIENLVGKLRLLRNKLETDRQRIQGDVAKYAELSQAVKRVTANISDSVVSLPGAPGIIP